MSQIAEIRYPHGTFILGLDGGKGLESRWVRHRLGILNGVDYSEALLRGIGKTGDQRSVYIVVGRAAEVRKGLNLCWCGRDGIFNYASPEQALLESS